MIWDILFARIKVNRRLTESVKPFCAIRQMTKYMAKAKPKKVVSKKSKKIIKQTPLQKIIKIDGKLVGNISHYFSNIQVGIIKLSAPLALGDHVRIMGGEATDFNQKITSMQLDHREIKKAKKGDSVGFKAKEIVRDGYRVYKV